MEVPKTYKLHVYGLCKEKPTPKMTKNQVQASSILQGCRFGPKSSRQTLETNNI